MLAHTDDHADYLNTILQSERRVGLSIKWALLLLGLFSTRFLEKYRIFTGLAIGVLAYALFNLYFTYQLVFRLDMAKSWGRNSYLLSYGMDIAFASLIIYYSGAAVSELYFLYALLALKSILYYPAWHEALIFPFASGLLYTVLLRFSLHTWSFLTEPLFLQRYVLLFGSVLTSVYLGWLNEHNYLLQSSLRRSIAERTQELDSKTRSMQQMATSLGNRVLELRTLQEGIKAINSALALEDVLRLIVANASQVLEGARCSVALLDEERNQVLSMAASDGKVGVGTDTSFEFVKSLVQWIVENGKPLLIGDVRQDDRFTSMTHLPIVSVISVPLFLDDKAVGALIATSADADVFTTEDLNLLTAFADQAAVAVKNARLYEQLVEEQRQTEQIYQHVEERRNELEAILRGIGDGVIVTDPDLNLLLMNPVATRIFRVKADVSSSVSLSKLIPHQELTSLFQDALHGAGNAIVREISLSPAGDRIEATYQALASPILGADGKARGVVTVLRDVTSQKELERMKSSFLSVVSHELKTPLHSIKGFVDIILMGKTGPLTDTQADFLATVRDQTTHLQSLIDDLLEFSRLESGQIKLRLSEVSLSEVTAAVIDKLKPLAERGQIQLVNRVGAEIPVVEADYMRIEQVLTNLIDNAIKFTPPSGVVTIAAQDLGGEVQVAVSDTGIGIPASEQERIFERFYQVDSGSARHYRGTGLGLTICKHIVEYHHGRIWVESEVGKGSTFYFILPKKIRAEEGELLLDFSSLPRKEQRQKRSREHKK
nr:GAF domain-containing protein [Chloroflexota bacterium]